MNFPKIIHQTYKDENIPDHWKKSRKNWKKFHPNFEYKFWTDADIRSYIEKNHPDFLDLHDGYKYNIQRVDMIRYFILNDFGGIYSDLDLYPIENIEKHIIPYNDAEILFVQSGNVKGCITNSFMISKKNAELWKYVFEELMKPLPDYVFGKHLKVMFSTGPAMLTNVATAINQTMLYDSINAINSKKIFSILSNEKFMAYSALEDINIKKEGAILLPLPGKSWNDSDSDFFNQLSKYLLDENWKNKMRRSFVDDIDGVVMKFRIASNQKIDHAIKNIKNIKYVKSGKDNIVTFDHKVVDVYGLINSIFNMKSFDKLPSDYILYGLSPLKSLSLLDTFIENFMQKPFFDLPNKKLCYEHLKLSLNDIKNKMEQLNFKHTSSFLLALQIYTYYKKTQATYVKIKYIYFIPWIKGNNRCFLYPFIVTISKKNIFNNIYQQVLDNQKDVFDIWGIYFWINYHYEDLNQMKFNSKLKLYRMMKNNDFNADIVFSNIPFRLDTDSVKIINKSSQNEKSYCFCIGTTNGELNFSFINDHLLDSFNTSFERYYDQLDSIVSK